MFINYKQDHKMTQFFVDKQGNRDYKKDSTIWCQLTDGHVRCLDKASLVWSKVQLAPVGFTDVFTQKAEVKERGCCGSMCGGLLLCCCCCKKDDKKMKKEEIVANTVEKQDDEDLLVKHDGKYQNLDKTPVVTSDDVKKLPT